MTSASVNHARKAVHAAAGDGACRLHALRAREVPRGVPPKDLPRRRLFMCASKPAGTSGLPEAGGGLLLNQPFVPAAAPLTEALGSAKAGQGSEAGTTRAATPDAFLAGAAAWTCGAAAIVLMPATICVEICCTA